MLRQLELFGFKSFADRTVFEFSAGITGVVGPNGSGKSNVVDSIKWILGDQSARSLRGKEMTDVIFNGSAGRTGAQFAEATLVFDNQSRFLPLDQDEVSVSRRLWQSGDSEYLINRAAVRLRDVRDLFIGTGAGAAAYCIIEQGRVDQILQSNAATRRLIFEEAAGISRFKSRRTESERRLERVEQNLVRLTDIVDEVESQVSNLRTQAERATRYRQVSVELEQLWIGTAADDFRRLSEQRTELEHQLRDSADVLETLKHRQQGAEKLLGALDEDLSKVDDQLRVVERSRSEFRSRIASLASTSRHHVARDAELQSDVQRLQRQLTLMQTRVSEAAAEQAHLESLLEQEREASAKRRNDVIAGDEQLRELQHAAAAFRQSLDSARQQLLQQACASSEEASLMGGLRSEWQSARKLTADLEQHLEAHRSQVRELEPVARESRLAADQAREKLRGAEAAADLLLLGRDDLLMQRTTSLQSLAELREQRSGLLARRMVLEDLEDRQEGFGIGVREILRRATESDMEPWNLICGSVADLLDVDMENAALLEVALSGRAQLLVVRRLRPFVDYLNSGKGRLTGRVGFISLEDAAPAGAADPDRRQRNPIVSEALRVPPEATLLSDPFDSPLPSLSFPDHVRVTWIDSRTESPVVRSVFSQSVNPPPSLFGRPGVVGRADGLARSPRHLPNLASNLLADTWVVEALADALQLQAETRGECRFVTLQGELLDGDGVLYAGSVRGDSAVLSRKSELRRLRNELHRTEHEIAQREMRLQQLAGSIQSCDEDMNHARQLVLDATAQLQQTDTRLAELHRVLAERQQLADQRSGELARSTAAQDSLKQLIDDAEQRQARGEQTLHELQQQISELERQQSAQQRELESLERERTDASIDLTRSEQRLLGLQEAAERVREDLQQRQLQHQEAGRRLDLAQERLRDIVLAQLNCQAEISELLLDDEFLGREVQQEASTRNVLRQQRNEAIRAEQQVRDDRQQHEARHHAVALQLRGIDHQLESTASRIRDEYQIDVADAVAAGRSAVAIWLHRRPGSPVDESDIDHASESLTPDVTAGDHRFPLYDDAARQTLQNDVLYGEIRVEVDRRLERLRRQLRKIGHVGTEALDNLQELESRFQRLNSQLRDLEAARDTLRDMVRRINVESRRMFVESFENIRTHFRELFRRLFGGGEADLVLEDPDDVLECAIDVVARPPGKELRSISLLSGGEKTMTAVALLLSIFRSRPSPFCILDEVDAALDDANIGRFVSVLRDFQQSTQFIMITHRKPTMAVTDVLYGVTMEESGISRRLSLRFEDVDERGNFNPKPARMPKAA